MAKIKINGITIELPFEPYESQRQTMEKILKCLSEKSSGMIESPTGTGKSLSIICSVLAYKENLKKENISDSVPVKKIQLEDDDDIQIVSSNIVNINNTKIDNVEENKEIEKKLQIVVCSRTHKQLDQLVQQLKKTKYKPRMTILASRTQYCVNFKVKSSSDINSNCTKLIKDVPCTCHLPKSKKDKPCKYANEPNHEQKGCEFYEGRDKLVKKMGSEIFDIEEISTIGKECHGCPYYASRKLSEEADIIFAPYNYILDPKISAITFKSMGNLVVIVDEAHNIDDVCRSAGSLELTSKLIGVIIGDIESAIRDAHKKIEKLYLDLELSSQAFEEENYFNELITNFKSLIPIFDRFKANADKVKIFDKVTHDSKLRIRKAENIKSELKDIGITPESFFEFTSAIHSISIDEKACSFINSRSWQLLISLDQILSHLLHKDSSVYSYAFNKRPDNNQGNDDFSYNFWLLDSAFIFAPFANCVRALVLLSGTLTPFESYSSELGHKFAHQLLAQHLINENQVFISCIKKGHLYKDLIGTFKHVRTFEYLDQISKIILDMSNKVEGHGGTLVFVPSYTFIENLLARINLLRWKNILCEPKTGGPAEFELILKRYHEKIALGESVILLCVYRGKASEGVDFKDSSARAVICVGIPYPSLVDPQIELKKEYNDKNKHFNGRRWYETQAFRAVNQAVGRAIRHKDDWGIILMLDSRYEDERISGQLSGWVTEYLKVYNDYESSLKYLDTFLLDK